MTTRTRSSDRVVPLKRFFLSVPICMLLTIGCESPRQVSKPPPVVTEVDVLRAEKERAIAAAKEEVVRRGWHEFVVYDASLSDGRWRVILSRRPMVWGGHASIEVSRDGKVISFQPGM